ncbi:MAG: tail fiber domain-containing protein [bacterium]
MRRSIPLFVAFLLSASVSWGQIPQTISYQGVLTDASGNVVADGNYQLTFRLYDSESSGTSLWSEIQTLTTTNGLFNTVLGNVTSIDLPFDRQYWLGISVGQDSELKPRIKLTSSPYSFNTQSIADSIVTGEKIASGEVVRSINSITDEMTLAAGANVTITQSKDTLYISATGGAAGGVNGSGQAGQIVFWTEDSEVSGDTELLWDNENKKLGIGTSNFKEGLNLNGNMFFTNDDDRKIDVGLVTSGSGKDLSVNAGSTVGTNVKGGELSLKAGFGDLEGGNLNLEAGDASNKGGDLILRAGSGKGNGQVMIFGTSIGLVSKTRFNDPDPDTVFIDARGNVGIGTTEPEEKLSIKGNLLFASENSPKIRVQDATFGTGTELTIQAGRSGSFGPFKDGGILNLKGGEGRDVGGDVVIQAGHGDEEGGSVHIKTGAGRIGAGIVTISGEVGIGRTPEAKLHIGGEAGKDGIMFPDGTLQTTAYTNGGLSLPFSASANAPDTPVFSITQTGKTSAQIDEYGNGPAGLFEIDNLLDESPALMAVTNGQGVGLLTKITGTGFGIHSIVEGVGGPAGLFHILPDNNNNDALNVWTAGTGRAAIFRATNEANDQAAIRIEYAGTGSAFQANHAGISGAIAEFQSSGETQVTIGKSGVVTANGGLLATSVNFPTRNLSLSSLNAQSVQATNDLTVAYGTVFSPASIHFVEGSNERMRIHAGGNVGIGTGSGPSNILTIQQNSATDPIADGWTTYSSRRWKTNIQTLNGALDKVKRLRGVSYDWKADGKHDIGLIAEEVGDVIPEVVAYEENGRDAKSVDYARLVAVLIEAVKEQQKDIEELREMLKSVISEKHVSTGAMR